MPEPPRTPAALRLAVIVLAAQTAGLSAVVAFLVYQDLTAATGSRGGAVGVTLYAAVMCGLIAMLTWALWRRRRWARGPAVVLELLLLPIGYYLAAGGLAWLGVPVMVTGLVGAGALVAPTTRTALGVR